MSSGPQARPLPDDDETTTKSNDYRSAMIAGAVVFVILYTLWTVLVVPILHWVGWMSPSSAMLYAFLTVLLWTITFQVNR